MAWYKDYLSFALLVIGLHTLPWTLVALIAYFGQLGAVMMLIGVASECGIWYYIQDRRAKNYLNLMTSRRENWDIEKTMKEYLKYVKQNEAQNE